MTCTSSRLGLAEAIRNRSVLVDGTYVPTGNPSLHNIMAIAQVLQVGLDELVPTPWPDLRAGGPDDRTGAGHAGSGN